MLLLLHDAVTLTVMSSFVWRVYRKPGVTGRGLYELRPEWNKHFNLYFHHYSRADQSKVLVNSSYCFKGLCQCVHCITSQSSCSLRFHGNHSCVCLCFFRPRRPRGSWGDEMVKTQVKCVDVCETLTSSLLVVVRDKAFLQKRHRFEPILHQT